MLSCGHDPDASRECQLPPRPNVLLILIDQFRADLLDGVFADVARLPNLRALSDDAVVFRRHYSVTSPCGPSRVSLLTGQYAHNHRSVRNGTPLRHDTPNLAGLARDAGYDPMLFGYTDTTLDPRHLPAGDPRLTTYEEVMPGFREVVRMRQESGDEDWRDYLAGQGYEVAEGNALYRPDGDSIDAPAVYAAADSDTAWLTDRFLEYMKGEAQGWFAALTYIRPHPPFVAPAPYNRMYEPAAMPAPAEALDNALHPFVALAQTKTAASTVVGFPDLEATPETIATLRAIYLGLASEVDAHIGRVIGWLKDSGQYDDTLIVVTSDHGEMLGDFGLWGKGTFHDAAFHVPLVVRAPGGGAGVVEKMTESIDVAPTILEVIGAEVSPSMDGDSLAPLMAGQGAHWKTETVSEYDFGDPVHPTEIQRTLGLDSDHANLTVLRTDSHRLVQFAAGLEPIMFDMNGQGERRNLSDVPEFMPICLDLSRRMLCHRMVHPDGTFSRTMVVDGGVQIGVG
jgi:arylsulfatase A-like enzyme